MSGKRKKGSEKAAPRAYGGLLRHERETVQRRLERRASFREIARELGRSPSMVSASMAPQRFVTEPKARRGIDADEPTAAACGGRTSAPAPIRRGTRGSALTLLRAISIPYDFPSARWISLPAAFLMFCMESPLSLCE